MVAGAWQVDGDLYMFINIFCSSTKDKGSFSASDNFSDMVDCCLSLNSIGGS